MWCTVGLLLFRMWCRSGVARTSPAYWSSGKMRFVAWVTGWWISFCGGWVDNVYGLPYGVKVLVGKNFSIGVGWWISEVQHAVRVSRVIEWVDEWAYCRTLIQ